MTTVELVPATLEGQMTLAKALSPSDLLPRQYRDKPANVLVAVQYGAALGLSPMAAIQGIHVVEGKPTASAQLIGALVRNAGHRLRVSGDDTHAVAEIVRRDDPEFVFRAEWTMERAAKAGLAGKGVWKQYPSAMLKARAITEVARDACPEVLSGVAYTAEELDHAPAPVATVDTSRLMPKSHPAPSGVDTETGEIIEAEIVDDLDTPGLAEAAAEAAHLDDLREKGEGGEPDELRTDAQSKKLFALLRQLGIAERDQGLEMIASILGHEVESTKTLTKGQSSKVIEALASMVDEAPADEARF